MLPFCVYGLPTPLQVSLELARSSDHLAEHNKINVMWHESNIGEANLQCMC